MSWRLLGTELHMEKIKVSCNWVVAVASTTRMYFVWQNCTLSNDLRWCILCYLLFYHNKKLFPFHVYFFIY